MKTRELKYLSKQRKLQRIWAVYRKAVLGLATQASFPDSGYYYQQQQRKAERKFGAVLKAFKHCPPALLNKKMAALNKEYQQQEYNYNCKVQVVDKNGREWTASEMDAAMCNY